MYINPFWFGVIVTIFAEIGALFVWAIIVLAKRGKRYGN